MNKTILLMTCLLCMSLIVFSQTNPDRIVETVVQGQSWSYSFLSSSPIRNINVYTPSGALTIQDPQNGLYDSEYLADPDFEGTVTWVVEYSNIIGQKLYTDISLNVVRSVIEVKKDFAIVSQNSRTVTIDVLGNDFSSAGGLQLIGLDLIQNGEAEIVGDQIEFTIDDGFFGITHFNYFVEDLKGSTKGGVVAINSVDENEQITELSYIITNTSLQDIFLPSSDFSVSQTSDPTIGSLEQVSDFVYQYSPLIYAEGIEVIDFVSTGGNILRVSIEVLNNQEVIDFVIDDQVFTTRGKVVAFNPVENDYNKEVVIIDHSPELSNASGLLVYSPNPGFSGVKSFYYTVHDGLQSYTGNIEVFVGDYLPAKTNYFITVKENTPLVLEYQVPIKNFEFKVVANSLNGQVRTNLGQVSTDCQNSNGFKLIEYIPNTGFVGQDEFILEYCVIGGNCQNVTVVVDVVASDDDCGCIGLDCVWSGDINNDGYVSMHDLLPIGIHFGASGTSRSDDGAWNAKNSMDWVFEQNSGINQKFIDTDGNGIVSSSDTLSINDNYGQFHNLTAQQVLTEKDVVLSAVSNSSSINPGDIVSFDIYVGTENKPITDLQGLVFDVKVPANFVEPGSMNFSLGNGDLFGTESPVIDMFNEYATGNLEVGVVNTGTGISGRGFIGTTNITIVIDLDGLKPQGKSIPFELTINSSIGTDSKGNPFKIKGSTTTIDVNLFESKSNIESNQVEVITYPNPTTDIINFHANNFDELQEVSIFNTLGERVISESNIDSKDFKITQPLSQGFYLAHITTTKGKTVQKIQVIRN